jgi:hypothetical protein
MLHSERGRTWTQSKHICTANNHPDATERNKQQQLTDCTEKPEAEARGAPTGAIWVVILLLDLLRLHRLLDVLVEDQVFQQSQASPLHLCELQLQEALASCVGE